MASSELQIIGFLLSLVGLAATISATFMVEWKKQWQVKSYKAYEGLWMTCTGNERVTCESYESVLKLPTEVQATRAVMMLSIFLSALAVLVSTLGMKCTRFMDGKAKSKSTVAIIGGIMFMVSGLLVVIITSWYVKMIVQKSKQSHRLQSFEFGKAVFVSLAGGLLTVAGGAFLSCRRCSRSSSSESISSNQLITIRHPKSNYV